MKSRILKDGKLWCVLLCTIIFSFGIPSSRNLKAQVAGLNTLSVLDVTTTARSAGLGMDYLSVFDDDLNVAIDNASLLRGAMGNTLLFGFVPTFDGSNMTTLAYAYDFGRFGTMSFGMRMFNFGRFHGYDEEENYEGDFGAGDYSLMVAWSMWIDSSFSIGVSFKPVYSKYEQYGALAQAIDVSGSYVSSDRSFAATLMARNIGAQVMTFDNTVEPLPFELSVAMSYKLRGAPFRVYVALTELQQWKLIYEDPLHPSSTTDPFTGEVSSRSWLETNLDNLMRHTLFGLELNIGPNLYARVGYSYRQTAEMLGADLLNMSGFSFGAGLRVSKFEFAYSRRNYHLSQAFNYISLAYRF